MPGMTAGSNLYDGASYFVVTIARFFWGLAGLCLTCAGWGGILAGLSFCDMGYWPWPFMALWVPSCLFLVWLSAPTQRRYQRWMRPADNPQGELK